MADSQPSLVDDLHDRFLQCSICMEAYKSPRMLPCIHSFCLQCLEKCMESSKKKCQPFSCPTCRGVVDIPPNGLKDLPNNFLLVSLMDRLNLESTASDSVATSCHFCKGNQRIQLCVDCCIYICFTCRKVHDRIPHCDDHILIPTEKLRGDEYTKVVVATQAPQCTEHRKEKLRFYCTSCNKLVCRDCAVVSHQGHTCVEVDKKVATVKQELEAALRESEEHVESANEIRTKINSSKQEINGFVNEAEQKIKEYYNSLVERLTSDKNELMEELQKIKTEQIDHWKELDDSLTNWQEVMENTKEVTKKILAANNKWDILAMGKGITDAFEKLCVDKNTMGGKHPKVQKGIITGIEVSGRNVSLSASTLQKKDDLPTQNILGKINQLPNSLKQEQRLFMPNESFGFYQSSFGGITSFGDIIN